MASETREVTLIAGLTVGLSTAIGKVLADPNGMTLYTYVKDSPGKSNCYGECVEYWPPMKAAAEAKPVGDLTIISATTERCNGPTAVSRCTPSSRTRSRAT
jgi:predicted lipoprotein with Yx(FWY)xxD motif